MLKNTKLATQLVGAFALISILIVALGLFSWQRLNGMDRALIGIGESLNKSIEASDLQNRVNAAGLALATFVQTSAPTDGETAIQRMEAVRDRASMLEEAGIGAATDMVALKERHIAELRSFADLYIQRRALKDRLRSLGIEHRRNIGKLVTLLEERGADIPAYRALRASESFLVTRVRVDRFVGGMPPSELDTAQPPYEAALENLAAVSTGALTAEERAILNTAQRGLPEFWSTVTEIRTVEIASRQQLEAVNQTKAEVQEQLSLVQDEIATLRDRLNADAHRLLDQTVLAILAGVALVTLMGGATAAFLSVHMSRRLNSIVAQTTALADGDLDVEITGTDGRGDLGQIAQALNVFRENALARQQAEADRQRIEAEATEKLEQANHRQGRVVHDIETGLRRLSAGELTHTIPSPANDPFPAEYEDLRIAFNTVATNLSNAMGGIFGVAEQVRNGSEEITAAAQDLAGRAETQAATLEQSAAALNELSESVRSTADLARDAEKATQDNRDTAEDGATIVNDAITAMKKIEDSSEQITRIIGVIDDIAFQTNLLALNAGVEAARAGEAGRGFAVVASEVRGLAQRASESAREIKALISESTQQVETGSSLVTRTGDSLAQILQKAKTVSEQVSAIAVAASDQASALGEINAGVNQLDQVTQQNAAVAEQTNAAAGSLQQQSAILVSELSNFRFDRAGVKPANMVEMPQPEQAVTQGTSAAMTAPARSASGGQARLVEF